MPRHHRRPFTVTAVYLLVAVGRPRSTESGRTSPSRRPGLAVILDNVTGAQILGHGAGAGAVISLDLLGHPW